MRIILTIAFSLSMLSMQANILYVGPAETYASLEAAAKDVLPGDTILFRSGTYGGGQFLVNVQGTEQQLITILAEQMQAKGGTRFIRIR